MDIGSKNGYPSSSLSNFSPHPFVIDGVECASMEGFLQSLKFKQPEMQVYVCKLVGLMAKKAGRNKKWWKDQTLYWQGVPYHRDSEGYQKLLDKAYGELFKNDSFRRALIATRKAVLTHSIGKSDSKETVLTRSEFCGRLMRLRDSL